MFGNKFSVGKPSNYRFNNICRAVYNRLASTHCRPMNMKRHQEQRGSAATLLLGFIMMCAGGYLLLESIVVSQSYFLGVGLYHMGGMPITGGMILVPLIFGIGIIFYRPSNLIGWALAIGSLTAMILGVIVNTHFALRSMSLFELIGIFVLCVGGLGLFLRALSDGRRAELRRLNP